MFLALLVPDIVERDLMYSDFCNSNIYFELEMAEHRVNEIKCPLFRKGSNM